MSAELDMAKIAKPTTLGTRQRDDVAKEWKSICIYGTNHTILKLIFFAPIQVRNTNESREMIFSRDKNKKASAKKAGDKKHPGPYHRRRNPNVQARPASITILQNEDVVNRSRFVNSGL
jgi:hypothetical protein